jgi:lipopolysaccharide-binding protein
MSGINVAVDIKGLNKLVKEILPTFLETIETMAIPNIEHQEAKIPLGHIFVDVTDIDIGNVQIPAVTLDTQEPNIVGFSSTGMNIPVHANWHYVGMGWPHIADSGSVDVTAQDGTAACQLKITEVNHRPNATMLSDTIGFSDYHISVHGGHSWLYNIISDIFHRAIKGALNTALSKALTSALGDQLNTFFQGIPISYTLKTPEIENLELRLNASLLATTMSAFGGVCGTVGVELLNLGSNYVASLSNFASLKKYSPHR